MWVWGSDLALLPDPGGFHRQVQSAEPDVAHTRLSGLSHRRSSEERVRWRPEAPHPRGVEHDHEQPERDRDRVHHLRRSLAKRRTFMGVPPLATPRKSGRRGSRPGRAAAHPPHRGRGPGRLDHSHPRSAPGRPRRDASSLATSTRFSSRGPAISKNGAPEDPGAGADPFTRSASASATVLAATSCAYARRG